MRVLEPNQLRGAKRHKRRSKAFAVLLILLILAAAGGTYWYILDKNTKPVAVQAASTTDTQTTNSAEPAKTGQLKQFTGEEFKALYHSVAYPNTQPFTDPPNITGDKTADVIIRKMAEDRGYKLTSIPVAPIVKLNNEPRLADDDLLQPLAATSWEALKLAAKKDGYPFSLISAYRSPDYQRDLFMQRLLATGTSVNRIAAGLDADKVDATLHLTAVPGYSRHQTGYTVDMWCEDGSGTFLSSSCYQWISANNYEHAKQFGWIPSYPAETAEQGPEPEPWEYVYVGLDKLTN